MSDAPLSRRRAVPRPAVMLTRAVVAAAVEQLFVAPPGGGGYYFHADDPAGLKDASQIKKLLTGRLCELLGVPEG